jgi:hypothetical protein
MPSRSPRGRRSSHYDRERARSRSPLHGTHSTGCGGGTNGSLRAPKGGTSRVRVRRVSSRTRGNASQASPSQRPRTSMSTWTGLIRSAQRLPLLKSGVRPQGGNSCQAKPQSQFLTLPRLTMQEKTSRSSLTCKIIDTSSWSRYSSAAQQKGCIHMSPPGGHSHGRGDPA